MFFAVPTHDSFATTGPRGLRRDSPALRLFEKSKRLGTWNPSDIDFAPDRAHWAALTDRERDGLLRLVALFSAGEECVTLDLLPLVQAIAREGRIEEEMYLAAFLWEEAKHVDFMRRFLDEVAGARGKDLHGYHTESYRRLFYEMLPQAMGRLAVDPSPEAQAEGSVTYNMVVEGVVAETGYHGAFTAIRERGIMPGLAEGLGLMMRDESRHIAYGIYLLSRLVAAHEGCWDAIQRRMAELMGPATGLVDESLAPYEPDVPFGLDRMAMVAYAASQFEKRMARLERARGRSLEEIERIAVEALEADG